MHPLTLKCFTHFLYSVWLIWLVMGIHFWESIILDRLFQLTSSAFYLHHVMMSFRHKILNAPKLCPSLVCCMIQLMLILKLTIFAINNTKINVHVLAEVSVTLSLTLINIFLVCFLNISAITLMLLTFRSISQILKYCPSAHYQLTQFNSPGLTMNQ